MTDTPHRPLVVNLSKLEDCARGSGGVDQVEELRNFFATGWSVFHLYKAIPKRLRLQNKFNDGGYNGAAFLHRKRRQLVIGKHACVGYMYVGCWLSSWFLSTSSQGHHDELRCES